MAYGLPYMGSKNKIVDWIIGCLPSGGTFYDLFCGGCAVTHAAMLSGKWDRFVINDIDKKMPEAFVKALSGGFKCENRVIDRETFKKLKDTDPYVSMCYSFGNNGKSYLWGEDVAEMKLIASKMLMSESLKERVGYYRQFLKMLSKKIVSSCDNAEVETIMKRASTLENFQNFTRVENIERLFRLRSIKAESFDVSVNSGDYAEVDVSESGVIYCDIPYHNTNKYSSGSFDYERFYSWAESQKNPVFISEYWMPEDKFKCIAENEKTSSYSASSNNTKTVEKLFVPMNQKMNTSFDKMKEMFTKKENDKNE